MLTETAEMTKAARLIEPEKLGYTDIYLDFVAGKDKATEFYLAPSLADVGTELDRVEYDREAIVGILTKQNEAYQASAATRENIEKLRDSRAVCVFAGQQAGLFGGPMLTMVKALAVIKAAERYSKELDRPVVPMFWIAGDDHDFEEANHTFVLTRKGDLCKNTYQTDPPAELPTAEIKLDDADELGRLMDQLKNCLGETDFTPDLFDSIARSYTPEDTMVTAFGKLMAALTADLGLVFFSPGDPAAKKLAIPFLKAVVEQQQDIQDRLNETNERLLERGYHLQVEKKDNAVHLFYNDNGRRPLLLEDGKFVTGEKSFSRDELVKEIETRPERFSPDVMTRPVMQSYLFPVVSQKGGPAEIAYLAQLNSLFDLFDRPAPVHKARPTLSVVEKRTEKHMAQHQIEFEDLLGDIEQVINRVLAETFPENLEQHFEELRGTVEEQFKRFAGEALDFEPGMKKYAEQIQGKVDYLLKGFESKVFAAHKKKSQQTRDRIYRINNALYPHHGLQERCLNITYFLSRYGLPVIKYIYDRLDSEETAHQLISLSEYD